MQLSCAAVLFDSDGVLVDSHLDGRRAWDQLASEFDLKMDDETFTSLAGVRPVDSLARFIAPPQLDLAVRRLEDLEVGLASSTAALPGAQELVASIPANQWAIVTSASRRLGVARWEGAGIPLPEVVVSAEDVSKGKPDPEAYQRAAEKLGVRITDCLVVEDSPAGGQAGLTAGAQVLAVGAQSWTFSPTCRVADLSHVALDGADGRRLSISVVTA